MTAPGRLQAIRRHPVKGFTPERLAAVALETGRPFPCDRLFAVENGPSGFDPAAPAHVSKARFTALAHVAAVARARTAYDESTGVLTAEVEGREPFLGRLTEPVGRAAFARWLDAFLQAAEPESVRGPLQVVSAPGHSFTDDPRGQISLLNLATVRELGERVGERLDPERFRCNLHVEGWPAWAEMEPAEGVAFTIGGARLRMLKPIRRCAATHVDPATGVRDLDVVSALRTHYGHMFCGVYLTVERGGRVAEGDAVAIGEEQRA